MSCTSVFSLVIAALAACGGGGDAEVNEVVASEPAAIQPSVRANAVRVGSVATTGAASVVGARAGAATGGSAPATGVTNSDYVGGLSALTGSASLSIGGLSDRPVPAPALPIDSSGRTFYLDSNAGNDSSTGRAATSSLVGGNGPWRSLARLMTSGLAPGDNVVLACGSIWNETLRLPMSGSATHPITVGAPRTGCGSPPMIDGSVAISASAWTRYKGNIFKAALDSVPLQLFGNSGFFTEAHHPNRGKLADDLNSGYASLYAAGNAIRSNGKTGSDTLTIGADLALPQGAAIGAGARLRLRTHSWLIDEATVASVKGNILTLGSVTSYPATAGWGYFLLGQLWMIDSAGEWAYDAAGKQIYAWMPDSAAPSDTVSISTLAAGIDLNSKKFIALDGLAVRRVGHGIAMRGSEGVQVRNTVVNDTAEMGADAAYSKDALFEANSFSRNGHDAISGQDDTTGAAVGMVVRNNLIRDAGVIMQGDQIMSLPKRSHAAIRSGSASRVSGNSIVNAGYIGIRVMSGSVVEDNFVFGACTVLDDCGGIYVWSEKDVVIRRNTVIRARGNVAGKPVGSRFTQAQGIYLDDQTSGVLIEDNTVVDTDNGVLLHTSANNTVRGNRLYGNRRSQIWLQDGTTQLRPSGDVFGNSIVSNQIAPVQANALGLLLETSLSSTAAFGNFQSNRYFERSAQSVVSASTSSGTQTYTLAQWRQSSGTGSSAPVDTFSTGSGERGYAAYSIAGPNLLVNAGLLQDASGWSAWNQTAPMGQLIRESCTAGKCLRYTAGGSIGVLVSPNFSVTKGQWYRLTVDLAASRPGLDAQIVIRRGGGGKNGYESVSDRSLGIAAGTAWARYSLVFQASSTVTAGNPATGDLGARVDIDNIQPGTGISLANMELVSVVPLSFAQTSVAAVNAGPATLSVACPMVGGQAVICSRFFNLADDLPVAWPMTLTGRSASILYAQDNSLIDSDGDGIPDIQDRCPGTVRGAAVNASGCALGQH